MRNQKGQTLIEVLAAMFIMVFGIISLVTLAITSNVMARQSSHELVATNLAREGLEVARNIRDSNWLQIEANTLSSDQWDNGLYSVSGTTYDYRAILKLDPSSGQFTLVFRTPPPASLQIWISSAIANVVISSNLYTQNISPHTDTIYNRITYLYPICYNSATGAETIITSSTCAASGLEKIGIDVRAQVLWQENGVNKYIILEEKMYAWKY